VPDEHRDILRARIINSVNRLEQSFNAIQRFKGHHRVTKTFVEPGVHQVPFPDIRDQWSQESERTLNLPTISAAVCQGDGSDIGKYRPARYIRKTTPQAPSRTKRRHNQTV
jgi:hypothetical protein